MWACFRCAACLFQSTPSARRATNEAHFNQVPNLISIHALREEGDGSFDAGSPARGDFNPRPPRGERPAEAAAAKAEEEFQSTPSARRATERDRHHTRRRADFNPRPPRGERRILCLGTAGRARFQSTPSARRATGLPMRPGGGPGISIHALREESDAPAEASADAAADFNPRPPRGERPRQHRAGMRGKNDFNPRPPRGERRFVRVCACAYMRISIHALREESDVLPKRQFNNQSNFNPRPPRGERQNDNGRKTPWV